MKSNARVVVVGGNLDDVEPGTALEIETLAERRAATVIEHSPYDPDNQSLRA